MKKVLFFACAAMLTLASCGGGNKPEANVEDAAAAVEELAADPEISALVEAIGEAKTAEDMQGVMAQAQAKYQELLESGKLDQAKEYMKAVQNYIAENAETIKSTVGNNATVNQIIDAVKALPTDADITAEAALAAVQAAASGKAADVLEAVKNAAVSGDVSKIAEKAAELGADAEKAKAAVDAAKEQLDKAPEDVKQAAKDAVEEAKTKAKDAAQEKAAEAVSKGLDKLIGK